MVKTAGADLLLKTMEQYGITLSQAAHVLRAAGYDVPDDYYEMAEERIQMAAGLLGIDPYAPPETLAGDALIHIWSVANLPPYTLRALTLTQKELQRRILELYDKTLEKN
jgi:hypothetical protein